MSRRAFYVVPLVALIVFGLLLAAGAFALHGWAWSQGYVAGQWASGAKEAPPMSGFPMRPFGMGGFFCAPTLLIVLAVLVLVGTVGKWIHMWTRHSAMRRYGRKAMPWGPGGRHWHRHPVPPWFCEWPTEKRPEETPPPENPEAGSPPEE